MQQQEIKNPYKSVQPVLTNWQQFTDRFFGTNNAELMKYQNDLLGAQWDAEYQAKINDRDYNSLANQVEQQRQLGINPDLNGVSPFEANTQGNPMNAGVAPSTGEVPVSVQKVASAVFQGIQLFLGAQNGILSLAQGFQNLIQKRNESSESFFNMVRDTAHKILQDDSYRNNGYQSFGEKEAYLDVRSRYPLMSPLKARKLSKKTYEYLKGLDDSLLSDTLQVKAKTENLQAHEDMMKAKFSPYQDYDFNQEMGDTAKLLIRMESKVKQKEYQLFGYKHQYDLKVLQDRSSMNYQKVLDWNQAQASGLDVQSKQYDNKVKEYNAFVEKETERFFRSIANTALGRYIIISRLMQQNGATPLQDIMNVAQPFINMK